MSYATPVLFVLFAWWFSTGVVIYLNNLPPRTFPWTVSAATALLPLCLFGLYILRDFTTPGAAYWSFTWGLLAWAWTQLTFYTGTLTGPRRTPCEPGCTGLRHFWHALETSLYHEIAAIGIGAAIFMACYSGANWCGAWTYAILWVMHSSAKVNAVLGVRNLNEEFFPPHLRFLRSFLRQRAINALFPFSITGGTVAAVLIFENAVHAVKVFDFVNAVLLGTIMALAIVEHWLLILPIPAAALWAWGLSSRKHTNGEPPAPEPMESIALDSANLKPLFAAASIVTEGV